MPNHSFNTLRLSNGGLLYPKIKKYCTRKKASYGSGFEMSLDFEKIIPMPKSLHITSGSGTDDAVAVLTKDNSYFKKNLEYPWAKEAGLKTIEDIIAYTKKKLTRKELREGRVAIQNKATYGHANWYDWSCANWGTKWNAYDCEWDGDLKHAESLRFCTAWDAPHPVLEKLATLVGESLELEYWIEGTESEDDPQVITFSPADEECLSV